MVLLKFPYTVTVRFDGLVLAKYVENDDWVRRAADNAPMAMPPTNPIKRTRTRQPPRRRRKLARNRYDATRRSCRITATR